ncbi:MAG: FtsX-like permease family protein [Planctomycetota bacterium]
MAFAPVTLPVYVLFLAMANLLGGAFYIVIEATAARVLKRPIALSRRQMILLALPVLVSAPLFAAAHFVLFTFLWIVRTLETIGRWQTGSGKPRANLAAGTMWLVVALWTSLTCMNAALGSRLIGRPVEGSELYVDSLRKLRSLGDLPAASQTSRKHLIAELELGKEAAFREWALLKEALEQDATTIRWLPDPVRRKLVGLPWYYLPAAISDDGEAHSVLFLGPLLLLVMMLMRWPGMFGVMRAEGLRWAAYGLRTGGAFYAIHRLITWAPLSEGYRILYDPDALPLSFRLLSPAYWLGVDYFRFAWMEWYLLNVGMWLALVGVGIFLWWTAWWLSPLLGWPRYYVTFLAARLLQRKRIAFFSIGAVTLCVAMMIIVISVMGGFVDSIRDRARGLLGDLVMESTASGFPYYQGFIDKIGKLRDARTKEPIVVQATPLIRTYGVIQFPKTRRTYSVHVVGIRLDEYAKVTEFGKDLFYQNRFGGTTLEPQGQPVFGRDEQQLAVLPAEMEATYRAYVEGLPAEERAEEVKRYQREPEDPFPGPGVFKGPEAKPGYEGKEYPGLILGRSILFRRLPTGEFDRHSDYPRGEACQLTLLPMSRTGDISPEPPPKPAFRYVDDSRSGIHEIDSVNVYVDFDRLQQLMTMGPETLESGGLSGARCNQVLIKVAPAYANNREKLLEIKRAFEAEWEDYKSGLKPDRIEESLLHNVGISTWEEMQASYIAAIEKEKVLVLIMFGVISLVAVFLILCIFYMIVQEKTRDIGIIKSIGGSAEGVAAVFLAYGAGIGLVGCMMGTLLGTSFIEHINDIQDWLARLNPAWRVWSPETYSFDKIPDMWKWSEVIGISILAIVSSIIGATFPAIRAAKTWPVETLRYE